MQELPTGLCWYSVTDLEERSIGFARLEAERTPDGGYVAHWDLKIAPRGTPYEETREMSLDAAGELESCEYRVFGNLVSAGERSGDRWLVTKVVDGIPATNEAEPPVRAVTALGFILACLVPREAGARLSRAELDESSALGPRGEAVFTWVGSRERDWEGAPIAVQDVVLRWADGDEDAIQVGEDGHVVEAGWGDGFRLVLSSSSTEHLYRPPPPVMSVVPSPPDRLAMHGVLEAFSPKEVFDRFTKPALLSEFWAPQADIGGDVGGKYELSWPDPGWRLLGRIEAWEPGRKLAFTWKWQQTPDVPELLVTMAFSERAEGGTLVDLEMGTYEDTPADQKEREGHAQGWVYFFGRLSALREAR